MKRPPLRGPKIMKKAALLGQPFWLKNGIILTLNILINIQDFA